MIDLHCHLLPGIDDGPATVDEAVAQARAHVAAGVTTVVCTPHVSQNHRNTAPGIAAGVDELRAALAAEGVPLTILAGAEVALSRALELSDDELDALRLGDSPWLLLEPPLGSDVPRLAQTVRGLRSREREILIAHPERCAAFHRDPALLAELVAVGARAQITATSFTGRFGRTVERLARTMLAAGLVQVVASDAHDVADRPPGLAAPLEQAGLSAITQWAANDAPAAMLAGALVPPPPAAAQEQKRRRGFLRR